LRWWDVETWPVLAVAVGLPLAKALLLAGITWLAARVARSSFVFATTRTGADANLRLIVGRTVSGVVIILGAITILDTVGVPPTTLVTFIGVVGIGISLALQDILKSFFAGTYLLFERPFRIGDEISIKDQRGIVEHIGIRSTRLRTATNVLVAIPNAMLFAELVLNRTNERAPTEVRVAADNELATLPAAGVVSRADGRVADASGGSAPAASVPAAAGASTPHRDAAPFTLLPLRRLAAIPTLHGTFAWLSRRPLSRLARLRALAWSRTSLWAPSSRSDRAEVPLAASQRPERAELELAASRPAPLPTVGEGSAHALPPPLPRSEGAGG